MLPRRHNYNVVPPCDPRRTSHMKFEFIPCETVPKFGWCAQLRKGSDVASIYHGSWVETRGDWLAEGAWAVDRNTCV